MSNYYVTQNQKGGWNVRKENATRVSITCDTQQSAIQHAKQLSHNSGGGEVRIQGRDGKFRDSDTVSPGNDPFPPRDTKH